MSPWGTRPVLSALGPPRMQAHLAFGHHGTRALWVKRSAIHTHEHYNQPTGGFIAASGFSYYVIVVVSICHPSSVGPSLRRYIYASYRSLEQLREGII